MTKQKVVVKLSLDDGKKRTKALKTAVNINGVISVALDGDKLTVVGDGTDVVNLTTQLRKKLGYADLISVSSGDDKKEEKKENKAQGETKNVQPLVYPYQYSYQYPFVYHEGAFDHYNIF
ncbi:Heavy metal transport/detoxification superfamily protein [Rhynchospora pubera]|uniref:Heavy metal transport/detoxification superfamily protein n=1 Tax=Rhynchospora pubera TaxID=906938 RepID=A0AAV8HCZ8_9POAL|nr:Heavy metal transport/detoxification superfamily protein [Rhynchospora pubera]